MSADTIIKRILDESAAECAAVEAEAQSRAREIVDKAKADAQRRQADMDIRAQREAEEIHRRRMQLAELDGRKQALFARRALLDEAFSAALLRLKGLRAADWEALMLKRIAAGAETGEEKLIVREDEQAKFAALLPRVNEALRAAGKAGKVAMSDKTADFAGGFTLSGEKLELNSSYEVMLREARESAEREIAQMLFDPEV